jgi:hypothetical protein
MANTVTYHLVEDGKEFPALSIHRWDFVIDTDAIAFGGGTRGASEYVLVSVPQGCRYWFVSECTTANGTEELDLEIRHTHDGENIAHGSASQFAATDVSLAQGEVEQSAIIEWSTTPLNPFVTARCNPTAGITAGTGSVTLYIQG